MADFMEMIKSRRSVRKYEEKEVTDEQLNQVLEAIQWSPSWANTQCWEVVIIRDSNIRKQLQETIAPKNPATKAIVSAPVLLALCGKLGTSGYYKDKVVTRFGDWFMFDLGIAAQSISLTVHALGMASVMVGLFDHDKAKEILKLPEGVLPVVLIPMGYPAKTPEAPKRKNIKEFCHYDTF